MLLKKVTKTAFLIGLLALLIGCSSTSAAVIEPEPVSEPTAEGVIVLADISDDPADKIERFTPLADYLAANLGEYGIGVGEVKIAPDMETMAKWMAEGEVDFYYDSPYPAMVISDQSGAQPILRRWKKGSGEYHSVIFTLADSGIESLDDLQGQMVAFEENFSTSGYMLPLAYLKQAGFKAVEKNSADAAVADDEIGFAFSDSDEATTAWILSGRVAAGVLDNQTFAEFTEEQQANLVILAETEPIARQVVLAKPGMDPDLQAAVMELLMGLDETEEGQAILDTLKTSQFDELPGGPEAAFDRMRVMFELVQSE